MKKITILLTLLLFIFSTCTAFASRGRIVFFSRDTMRMVISTNVGFTCGTLSYITGWSIKRGDVVVGELQSFGIHEIYNLTDDHSFSLNITKCWATEDAAIDFIENGY